MRTLTGDATENLEAVLKTLFFLKPMNDTDGAILDLPERAPWWGADLQTLRQRLTRRTVTLLGVSRRLDIAVRDRPGDRMSGVLHSPATPTGRPLIVVLHGVSGSENSAYMVETACFFVELGHPVLRMNLSGAGPSAETSSLTYHAGATAEVGAILSGLPNDMTGDGVVLAGFSMGGSILLNGLAATPDFPGVLGAVTVSAPLDLTSSSHRLYRARNRVYEMSLLRDLIRQEKLWRQARAAADQPSLAGLRRLREFDDRITAPRHGFRDAADYYARSSGFRRLERIRAPLLLIHALDDPWICSAAYVDLLRSGNQRAEVALTRRGGHVGFHFRGYDAPWYNYRIKEFIDGLTA